MTQIRTPIDDYIDEAQGVLAANARRLDLPMGYTASRAPGDETVHSVT
jgi:hypothetical protein